MRETVPELLASVSRIVLQIEVNASLCWLSAYYTLLHYTCPHDVIVEKRIAAFGCVKVAVCNVEPVLYFLFFCHVIIFLFVSEAKDTTFNS